MMWRKVELRNGMGHVKKASVDGKRVLVLVLVL